MKESKSCAYSIFWLANWDIKFYTDFRRYLLMKILVMAYYSDTVATNKQGDRHRTKCKVF